MARRRMIDPNIWASEDMGKLTLRQRLIVIGLFSNADDYGKGKAKPAYVRSTIFPYDDIPLHDIIDDLETIRAVVSIDLYEVEGNSYYKFIHWDKWQTVQKPQKSIIPESVQNDSLLIPYQLSPKGKEEKGKEEKGKEEKEKETPTALEGDTNRKRILFLINECEVEDTNFHSLDEIESFIGIVDFEVIEAAIKKGQKKHVNYVVKTLKGMVKDGIIRKDQLFEKPKVGENNGTQNGEGIRQGSIVGNAKPNEVFSGTMQSQWIKFDKDGNPLSEVS